MIRVITLEQSEEWEELVKSFPKYDIYNLPGYLKAFANQEQGEARLFYYENDGLRAINAVFVRDIARDQYFIDKIPLGTYYDMTTPYGYGGFLIEGDATEDAMKLLNAEYESYCKGEGIISEFVRFHPVILNGEKLHMLYEVVTLGNTVTMKLETRQHIWKELSSKNRNMIRKAQKAGIKVYWGRSKELFNEFIPMYQATMERNQAAQYYYFNQDFYDSILYDLAYQSMIFYAVLQEKIIAMSILLFSNGRMSYHLSASEREFQTLAPTNLLLYEAACYGCEHGYRTFHLGGGVGCRKDNLYQFKKSFYRNEDTIFQIGRKIFDTKRYDELIRIRKDEAELLQESEFFPEYRN